MKNMVWYGQVETAIKAIASPGPLFKAIPDHEYGRIGLRIELNHIWNTIDELEEALGRYRARI
jgi:hypothetical protein